MWFGIGRTKNFDHKINNVTVRIIRIIIDDT